MKGSLWDERWLAKWFATTISEFEDEIKSWYGAIVWQIVGSKNDFKKRVIIACTKLAGRVEATANQEMWRLTYQSYWFEQRGPRVEWAIRGRNVKETESGHWNLVLSARKSAMKTSALYVSQCNMLFIVCLNGFAFRDNTREVQGFCCWY